MPINHEYFENTNIVQWLWYHYQDLKDQEEAYLNQRDLIEYQVGFLEPELVKKVINQRQSIDKRVQGNIIGTKDDAAFNESVKRMFGGSLNVPVNNTAGTEIEVDGLLDRIAEYEREQTVKAQTETPYNYKYWTTLDLE